VGKEAIEAEKDQTVKTTKAPLKKDRSATKAVNIPKKKAATTVGKREKVATGKGAASEKTSSVWTQLMRSIF
jgi:hypothetical protein